MFLARCQVSTTCGKVIADVIRRHPEIRRARLTVDNPQGIDRITLNVETVGIPDGAAEAIATSLRAVTKLRGVVAFHGVGELPGDGKIIEDLRSYE